MVDSLVDKANELDASFKTLITSLRDLKLIAQKDNLVQAEVLSRTIDKDLLRNLLSEGHCNNDEASLELWKPSKPLSVQLDPHYVIKEDIEAAEDGISTASILWDQSGAVLSPMRGSLRELAGSEQDPPSNMIFMDS